MTAFFTSTVRKVSLALAFAASFSAISSTSSFAFSAEAQQMCTGDAFRLCSSEIPEHPEDHRLHDQAARQPLQRLPHRDGSRSGRARPRKVAAQ